MVHTARLSIWRMTTVTPGGRIKGGPKGFLIIWLLAILLLIIWLSDKNFLIIWLFVLNFWLYDYLISYGRTMVFNVFFYEFSNFLASLRSAAITVRRINGFSSYFLWFFKFSSLALLGMMSKYWCYWSKLCSVLIS